RFYTTKTHSGHAALYSIISLAKAGSLRGIVRPSAVAVISCPCRRCPEGRLRESFLDNTSVRRESREIGLKRFARRSEFSSAWSVGHADRRELARRRSPRFRPEFLARLGARRDQMPALGRPPDPRDSLQARSRSARHRMGTLLP